MSALPRPPAIDRARRRRVATALLLPLLALALLPGPDVGGSDHGPQIWTSNLGSLEAPYNEATSITALELSQDGKVLVAGLDNGGLLFIDAATGKVLDAAHASDRGAVVQITLTGDGGRAAAIYADGHIAVVDRTQAELLLALNSGPNGIGSDAQARQAAVFARGGKYLIITQDKVYLYGLDTSNQTLRYVLQDSSPEPLGPFLYADPVLTVFGALSKEGALAIYTYGPEQEGRTPLRKIGQAEVDTAKEGNIVALAVSEDGERVALGHRSGAIRRYQPLLGQSGSQLKLEYSDDLIGSIRGLQLSPDGKRIAAWSTSEIVWGEGNNNAELFSEDEVAASNVARVTGPGFLSSSLQEVAFSRDLTRAFVRVEGRNVGTHLFNLPEFKGFLVDDTDNPFGLSTMDSLGELVYQAAGKQVEGFQITEKQLPPPALREGTNTAGSGEGRLGFALTTSTALIGGAALLVLLLLAILLPLVFAARRAGPTTQLTPLDPENGTPLVPLGSTGTGTNAGAVLPGGIARPVASQAMSAPAPEGILVLRNVHIRGAVTLRGIDAAWRRPGVVLLRGKSIDLSTFANGLRGEASMTGLVAVGGATADETPMLFSRRIQVGLAPIGTLGATANQRYREEAEHHRLPNSLVERRIHTDLGWMGARRAQPTQSLRPVDAWKLRLALAVIHRPHVLLLNTMDLPQEAQHDDALAGTVRQVLRGVAKQFEVLIVLLDEGKLNLDLLRRWADEEATLGPAGISDRTPLQGGQSVPEAKAGGRKGRTKKAPGKPRSG